MDSNMNVLVDRYIAVIKAYRHDVVAKKDNNGSLELSHSLWMLEKMKEKDFTSLTTPGA